MPNPRTIKSDGIETKVRVMKQSMAVTTTLPESLTARQLKQMLGLPESKNLEVTVIYHNSSFETIAEDEKIGDRLVSCKEILILPNGESKTFDFTSFETSCQSKCEPYQWFYELPESQRQRRVNDSDIANLAYCLGSEWPNVIMSLGIGKGQIEMEEDDYRKKPEGFTAQTELLSHWSHFMGKDATYECFIGRLRIFEKVRPGLIAWENIRTIFHN